MLKSFTEMMAIDISKECESRKAKGDNGKEIEIKYLNWAKCKKLLHDNGAKKVVFWPLVGEDGSSLFHTSRIYGSGERTNQCYEVGVHVVIDDLEFDFRGPLMNGSNPVADNSISQQRIWNAQARLFVKGVAMWTGLGFGLWLKEAEVESGSFNDLEYHSLGAIKERIEREVTAALDKGMTLPEIAKKTKIGEDEDDVREMIRYLQKVGNFEAELRKL